MTKKTPKKARRNTTAFKASTQGGEAHIVGIGDLRVMISKTETYWYAQGLEIDYAAQGRTLEEVQKHFGDGLHATITEHLAVHGTIEKLLEPAPPDVWKEFFESRDGFNAEYSTLGVHEMFPFDQTRFYVTEDDLVGQR